MTDLVTNSHNTNSQQPNATSRSTGRARVAGYTRTAAFDVDAIDESTIARRHMTIEALRRNEENYNPWAPDPSMVSQAPLAPVPLPEPEPEPEPAPAAQAAAAVQASWEPARGSSPAPVAEPDQLRGGRDMASPVSGTAHTPQSPGVTARKQFGSSGHVALQYQHDSLPVEDTVRLVSSLPGSRTAPSVGVSRSDGSQDRVAVRAALASREAPRPAFAPPVPPSSPARAVAQTEASPAGALADPSGRRVEATVEHGAGPQPTVAQPGAYQQVPNSQPSSAGPGSQAASGGSANPAAQTALEVLTPGQSAGLPTRGGAAAREEVVAAVANPSLAAPVQQSMPEQQPAQVQTEVAAQQFAPKQASAPTHASAPAQVAVAVRTEAPTQPAKPTQPASPARSASFTPPQAASASEPDQTATPGAVWEASRAVESGRTRKRVRSPFLLAGLAALAGVAALIWLGPLSSESLTDGVASYVDAVEAGDGETAMSMMAGARAGESWLPAGAYLDAESKPAELEYKVVREKDNAAIVAVSGLQNREPFIRMISLEKQHAGPLGLRTEWRITSGLEREVRVSLETRSSNVSVSELQVNSAALGPEITAKPEIALWALPGTYVFTPPTKERYFSFGEGQSIEVRAQEGEKPAEIGFSESTTGALLADASELADGFINTCLKELAGRECPNLAAELPVKAERITDFEWNLLSYRYVVEGDGSVLTFKGEYELTYSYEDVNRFTSASNPAPIVTNTQVLDAEKQWRISVSRTRDGLTLS